MSAPWRNLKDTEISMLAKRQRGIDISESEWRQLRDLFDRCQLDDDAEEVLCFHGVAALLAEHQGDYEIALHHRVIEIDKIVWLQEEEIRNPTNGFQTQDYERDDLAFRHQIVREIQDQL